MIRNSYLMSNQEIPIDLIKFSIKTPATTAIPKAPSEQ